MNFLPGVLKLNESERWSSSSVFQVDITDRSVFVKDVLDVFGADVGRQITDINPTVVVSRRTSDHSAARHILTQINNPVYKHALLNKTLELVII